MSANDQLTFASIHLKGKTHNWFRWWKREYGNTNNYNWLTFCTCFFDQCEDTWDRDFFSKLTRLRQISSVEAYTDEFQALQNMISQRLDRGTLIETFISGLKERIRMRLKTIHPTNLCEAISLAKATEAKFVVERTPYQRCDIPFAPRPEPDETQTTQGQDRPSDPL